METELLVEIKKEQVYVVLTQANIEARLQSSISGGLSDGRWHTLTLSIEDGKRFLVYHIIFSKNTFEKFDLWGFVLVITCF